MRMAIRVFVFVATLFLAASVASGYDNDHKSYGEAIKHAKKEKKPLFIMFTADWCSPCKQMEKETFIPLMKQMKAKCVVYFVDFDSDKEAKTKTIFSKLPPPWNFTGDMPTFYLTQNDGQRLKKKGVGYMNRVTFIKWFNQ